jgi:hypothetical protein
MPAYDLIGDTHGFAAPLRRLLERMGYARDGEGYRHPQRRVIFLGDFVDRGPDQREVLSIARSMVEAGNALAVMGNHELNALGWATENAEKPGEYLRPHSEKNRKQHDAFLNAYADDRSAYRDVLDWFRSLPLFLERDGLRVVHACWDAERIAWIRPMLNADATMPEALLLAALTPGTEAFEAVEILLKGKEVRLPEGHSFPDKEGTLRHRIRVKWWQESRTYREAYLGHPIGESHIPEDPIDVDYAFEYGLTEPPVFVGHYWLNGLPGPLTSNIACLDYSVAKDGELVAYRWDGEQKLSAEKFVAVANR